MAERRKKGEGMFVDAHPTAPGGMSEPALVVELVETHGWTMRDAKALNWPEKIDAVCQGRLDREAETEAPREGEHDGTADPHDGDGNRLTPDWDTNVNDIPEDESDDIDEDLDEDDTEFMVRASEVAVVSDTDILATPEEAGLISAVPEDEEYRVDLKRAELADLTAFTEDYIDLLTEEQLISHLDEAKKVAEAETLAAEGQLLVFDPNSPLFDYVFNGHAGAGPSASERWMTCTASLQASRRFLETLSPRQQLEFSESGLAARQGTVAHAVGEVKLREMLGEYDDPDFVAAELMRLATEPDPEEAYDEEMEAHLGEYVEYFTTYANEGHEVRVEARVYAAVPLTDQAAAVVGEEYYVIPGSSDAIALPRGEYEAANGQILTDTTLVVGDLKYGNGIDVSPDANPQVRIYALGVLGELADDEGNLPNITDVEYVIVQPRLGGVKVWTETVDDLLTWRDEVLSPALSKALLGLEGGAEFAPSEDACQFCPARGGCDALASARIEAATELFEAITDADLSEEGAEALNVGLMDGTRLGDLYTQIRGLVKLHDEMKAEVQRRLHRGEEVAGYDLRKYQPARHWTPEAEETLARDKRLWTAPKLMSPTQALIAVKGDEKATRVLEKKFIVKPDARPVVSSGPKDKRARWEGRPPEEMFADESAEEGS